MSLFQKLTAVVSIIIFCLGCHIVDAQESDPKSPELKTIETINFIQATSNGGWISVETDFKSSESNIKERIDFIQASFDKGQPRAKLWSYGWTAIYGVAAAAQTGQAIGSRHDRASNIVAASESFWELPR